MNRKTEARFFLFQDFNLNSPIERNLLKICGLILFAMLLTSCGSSRSRVSNHRKMVSSEKKFKTNPALKPEDKRVYKVISNAKEFEGTRYKYGGTTKRGMDCSGLIYVAYLEEDIPLPRTSRAMSLQGKRLYLEEVTAGDLLFFQTSKNKKVINHVGLVIEVLPGEILFIHSTTSRGVIISSLSETYWHNNFVMARRVI
ncbi:C40 family peptidase [Zunongwangia sp. H14]|uniref:C40 family peptidase n=1 Tax=Zunongwangia sp. H14 TaxID=3240792 RepID=UPI003563A2B7